MVSICIFTLEVLTILIQYHCICYRLIVHGSYVETKYKALVLFGCIGISVFIF